MELILIILIIILIIALFIIAIYSTALKLLYGSNAFTDKIKKIKSITYPIIISLTILVIWKTILPDNYYSLKRLLGSNEKLFNKNLNKGSFKNEVDALVTYGSLNHDINVLYNAKLDEDGNITELKEVLIKLKTESLVKIYDIKKSVKPFEGQGFIEIQIQNQNGNFVNGGKYYIEADYIDILSPDEIKNNDKNKVEEKHPASQPQVQSPYLNSSLSEELKVGSYEYLLKNGEMTGWKKIPGDCIYDIMCYSNSKPSYRIYYSDGTVVDFTDGINKELPRKTLPELRVVSLADQKLVIKVMPRKQM
jgi:hypothetical protein